MTSWLVTTSRSLLLVDGGSGEARVLHEGAGLYFGMSFDDRGGFPLRVAARGRMVSSPDPVEEERGRILLFDESLRPGRELRAPFPMRDLHQVLVRGGTLWATCSFDNMVAVLRDGAWEAWYPLGEPEGEPRDVYHFNTLAWIDGRLAIVAHNRHLPPSEILLFDWPSRELKARFPLGVQAHDVWRDGERWFTCSSGEGRIVDSAGGIIETGGFPRGVGFAPGETCVGISEFVERSERDLSLGQLQFRGPDWSLRRTLLLEGEGLVLDVLPAPPGCGAPAEAPSRLFRFA